MNWWKDGISIDEYKFSALIIGFILSLGFAVYFTYTYGDSPSNYTNIVLTLIWAIAGVNGIKSVSEIISKVKENSKSDDSFSDRI